MHYVLQIFPILLLLVRIAQFTVTKAPFSFLFKKEDWKTLRWFVHILEVFRCILFFHNISYRKLTWNESYKNYTVCSLGSWPANYIEFVFFTTENRCWIISMRRMSPFLFCKSSASRDFLSKYINIRCIIDTYKELGNLNRVCIMFNQLHLYCSCLYA